MPNRMSLETTSVPATRAVTTGTRSASASRTTRGWPSQRLVCSRTSNAGYSSRTSSRSPVKRTRRSADLGPQQASRRARGRDRRRQARRRRCGARAAARERTSASVRGSFCGAKRPTQPITSASGGSLSAARAAARAASKSGLRARMSTGSPITVYWRGRPMRSASPSSRTSADTAISLVVRSAARRSALTSRRRVQRRIDRRVTPAMDRVEAHRSRAELRVAR